MIGATVFLSDIRREKGAVFFKYILHWLNVGLGRTEAEGQRLKGRSWDRKGGSERCLLLLGKSKSLMRLADLSVVITQHEEVSFV